MIDHPCFTPEELDALSPLARMALAARCARLVLPVWDRAFPSASEHRAALEAAVRFAEQTAAGVSAHSCPAYLADDVLRAHRAVYGPDPAHLSAARMAAHFVTRAALEALRTTADPSSAQAAWACREAMDAAGLAGDAHILGQMRADFQKLGEGAASLREGTAVAPDFFPGGLPPALKGGGRRA